MSLRQHLTIYNAVYLVSTTSLGSKISKLSCPQQYRYKRCLAAVRDEMEEAVRTVVADTIVLGSFESMRDVVDTR